MSDIVNSIGLIFDILGAIVLFKFGLPASINREGNSVLLLEGTDERMRAKADRYDQFGRLGLGALITGFTVQLVSNFLA